MNNASKGRCVTVTPRGKEQILTLVKANPTRRKYVLRLFSDPGRRRSWRCRRPQRSGHGGSQGVVGLSAI
jgi:hypothetical protein